MKEKIVMTKEAKDEFKEIVKEAFLAGIDLERQRCLGEITTEEYQSIRQTFLDQLKIV